MAVLTSAEASFMLMLMLMLASLVRTGLTSSPGRGEGVGFEGGGTYNIYNIYL